MFRRRKGFALGLVLIVMIVLIAMSAIIMDLTTNYTSSSQSVIDNEKLMNAAQSGVEDAKAWLLGNAASLDVTQVSAGTLADIEVKLDDSSPYPGYTLSGDITVNVDIYTCNYQSVSYISGAPPIIESYGLSGGGSSSRYGYSNYLDPNRNNTGVTGELGHVFLVRSIATWDEKDKILKSMVVIAQ